MLDKGLGDIPAVVIEVDHSKNGEGLSEIVAGFCHL